MKKVYVFFLIFLSFMCETVLAFDVTSSENIAKYAQETVDKSNSNIGVIDTFSMELTGTGLAQVVTGLTEKKSDIVAVTDMNAYVGTFYCQVGNEKIKFADSGIVPQISEDFFALRSEYIVLSNRLEKNKSVLGLESGIESKKISENNDLYKNSPAYSSSSSSPVLSTAQQRLDSGTSAQKMIDGIVLLGTGLMLNKSSKSNMQSKDFDVKNTDIQNINKPAEERQKISSCPEIYCKGGAQYTDEETCEAWKLCGCGDTTPKEVCDTQKGQELCEC